MSSPEIIFNNNLTYSAGASMLAPVITALFNQDNVSKEYIANLPEKMRFTRTTALTPDQEFSIIIGAYELDEIDEDGDIPTVSFGKGKSKGFRIVQYGGKIGISKLFRKWLDTGKTLAGADTSVQQAWSRLAQDIISLKAGAVKSSNIAATEVLTKGWLSSAAYGAGSPTMYGQPLFSASHPYGQNGGTFSNLLTTPDSAFDTGGVQLQIAINIQKSVLRLQNGDRVEIPTSYTLITGNTLATTARKVLNTAGNQVGTYSGGASNAAQLNQFSFNGNSVTIAENPMFGFVKKNGTVVGSETMWFLMNTEAVAMAKALREIVLYNEEANMYQNDSNNQTFVSLDMGKAFDHFGLESFIVGSRGTV